MQNALGVQYNQQFANYLKVGPYPGYPQAEEAIDQPLYHIQTYPAAGASSFTFFGSTNGATGGYATTNLTNANQLPLGNRFLCRAISVFFIPGVLPQQSAGAKVFGATATSYVNDVVSVLEASASLSVTLTNKPYLNIAPLTYFPQGFGVSAESLSTSLQLASAADFLASSGHASNGLPTKGAMHMLGVPLILPALTNFSVNITYTALAPTQSTVAGKIGVALNGLLIRPQQ